MCIFCLLPVLAAVPAQAAIVATFPLVPERVSVALGGDITELVSVDFNGDSQPEFWMNSGGIGLFLLPPNRVFIRQSLPPNLGGLVGNVAFGFSIHADSVRTGYGWYEGFLTDSLTASYPELPRTAVVDFGGCFTPGGCISLFIDRSGYMALEMQFADGVHYGWVHINHLQPNGDSVGVGGYLDAWAYETVPGAPILAGAVPEPGTWTLSSAALLVALLRRRR